MSKHHAALAARLADLANLALKFYTDLGAMEKAVRRGPRPKDCLWLLGADPELTMGRVRCPACDRGPCPWGRPLQPGEAVE